MPKAVIVDVDGTLVDTNYQHAVAWFRAFREYDIDVPVWRIHRHIGMGGDQLITALVGEEVEADKGDAIRESEKGLYLEMIDEVRPLKGAFELLSELAEDGHQVVLASSAKENELEHYLDLLDVREVVHAWTSSADVDATKPDPDLIKVALAKSDHDRAVMIGDSTWDCIAAKRVGVATIGVLTGGFSELELREAGAVVVYESVAELRDERTKPPLGD